MYLVILVLKKADPVFVHVGIIFVANRIGRLAQCSSHTSDNIHRWKPLPSFTDVIDFFSFFMDGYNITQISLISIPGLIPIYTRSSKSYTNHSEPCITTFNLNNSYISELRISPTCCSLREKHRERLHFVWSHSHLQVC
jgi:hypothetical protein